ncbi:MAG: hypothetical protein NUW21_03115, partial [Elusimicrobia bacterium]|nr:hypothetical protein [Elusimicrobiota bacterium]
VSMKTTALLLAGLMLASAVPLRAQVVAGPAAGTAAPVKKPSCPCDNSGFKPLTDKARAVEAYWDARRKYNVASTIAGTVALFALISQNRQALYEAQESLNAASSELAVARAKALSLKGIKVVDGDDKTVELLLEKGVDYTL